MPHCRQRGKPAESSSVFLRPYSSSQIVFESKVSCTAAPVTEVLSSAEPWLIQFSAAQDTAVILTAPDIMIQIDKTAVPGKSSGFAVELHLILIQMQRPADHKVSDALHTHSEDLLLLRIRHSFHAPKMP